eukprot:7936176-Karenia_brevis.AAC.1
MLLSGRRKRSPSSPSTKSSSGRGRGDPLQMKCGFEFYETWGARVTTGINLFWGETDFYNMVGRASDLKAAYKQLPLASAHACFCVPSVLSPVVGLPKLLIPRAMMFGLAAAVYSLRKLSEALSAILYTSRTCCVGRFS